jgi:DNA modification methylase
VLSGNHRLRILRELGHQTAPVVVVDVDDARAMLLAQTLNRTHGSDNPEAYAKLLEQILAEIDAAEAASFLPETEATIEQILRAMDGPAQPEKAWQPPAEPRSKPGEIYELGEHRLLCADATNPEVVTQFLAGGDVAVMVADPPYGIRLDRSGQTGVVWARTSTLANDDRCDWTDALRLPNPRVAYLWHGALFASEAFASLKAAGFEVRSQIIWVKPLHVIGRGDYQWQHESCWYAVRRGASAHWQGGRKQSTVWEAVSPIGPHGPRAGADAATAHPTQKPVELFERAALNNSRRGEIIYDPFAGSGTSLIAAEKTGRICLAVELDPGWCDVIRDRYAAYIATAPRGGR